VDPARIGFLAYGLHDRKAFVDAVRAFADSVMRLRAEEKK
jgi:hypothetical protein